jgi:hypothetical protein
LLGKSDLKEEIMECRNRTLQDQGEKQKMLNEQELSEERIGAMFAERERKSFEYNVITAEDEGVSQYGQGYSILIKRNDNQNVQREGICPRINFTSTIQGIVSEAEKGSMTGKLKEREFNRQPK